MNRFLLQGFLLLALIPIGLLIGYGFLVMGPIICWGFAINAYRANNDKELYFWLFIGLIGFNSVFCFDLVFKKSFFRF